MHKSKTVNKSASAYLMPRCPEYKDIGNKIWNYEATEASDRALMDELWKHLLEIWRHCWRQSRGVSSRCDSWQKVRDRCRSHHPNRGRINLLGADWCCIILAAGVCVWNKRTGNQWIIVLPIVWHTKGESKLQGQPGRRCGAYRSMSRHKACSSLLLEYRRLSQKRLPLWKWIWR